MKKHISKIIGIVLFSTLFSPYSAAEKNKFRVNATYLFNVTAETNAGDVEFEEKNGIAASLGYRPLSFLILEVGTVNFDVIDSLRESFSETQRTEHQVSGYTAGVKLEGSFNGLFNVWGSVGQYEWDSTFNYSITYPNFPAVERLGSDQNSGSDMYYRLGVNGPLFKNVNFSVEVAHFEMTEFFSSVDSGTNMDFTQRFIGLGLEMNFW